VSHLTKAETSHVIWLNIVTIVARSVRLCPHACATTFMPLVNSIVNDGLVNAMLNMQKTLLQFTTLI